VKHAKKFKIYNMKKGFLIYALGHSNYYRMAEVLAASLIVNDAVKDGIFIAVVCDNEKKLRHQELFNVIIHLPQKKFMVKDKVVFNNATILAYELSPFETTIKLDADMVWLTNRKPAALFDSLENVDLAFENNGFDELQKADRKRCVWAPPAEIQEAYSFTGNEKCYTIFGEFLYFKKTKENKAFFKSVKSIYHKPKVKCADFANGTFTDELAMQIAVMQTGKYPHEDNFAPVFNQFLHLRHLHDKHAYQLPQSFYAYSIGGNITPPWQRRQYNILANHYFRKLGLQNPFQSTDKRRFLPERIKL
jgi:hypothetical protein